AALITPAPRSSPARTAVPTIINQVLTTTPISTAVNGIPVTTIVVMPAAVQQRVREVFTVGQSLGRDPRHFSKLGDSLVASPSFLTRFDTGRYNLGVYNHLQPTIEHYAGSFGRYGIAIRVGLHAWAVFDPLWANKEFCEPNETLLACELRLYNPSVLLINLGSNDDGPGATFNKSVREIVDYCLANGVIPVLATKADRFEGEDNRNNLIMRQVAADYAIPLWDFDLVAETLPGRGLGEDQVHLTSYGLYDYTEPIVFRHGYPVLDLTALMVLNGIWQTVADLSGPAATPNSQ
ncbi:MAG: SGNH/GDSL hydrolase family protein, partial [Chloroflexota bacterium]